MLCFHFLNNSVNCVMYFSKEHLLSPTRFILSLSGSEIASVCSHDHISSGVDKLRRQLVGGLANDYITIVNDVPLSIWLWSKCCLPYLHCLASNYWLQICLIQDCESMKCVADIADRWRSDSKSQHGWLQVHISWEGGRIQPSMDSTRGSVSQSVTYSQQYSEKHSTGVSYSYGMIDKLSL